MEITQVNLGKQLSDDYLKYSMSVIIGRAIPDLRDGLKPVQRRVLTAMKWMNLHPDAKYMKSARVEGETMGKLHPHSSAYGVLVNMAAWWKNSEPLVDGHGNFGSPTDNAGASRYTEARLTNYAWKYLLEDFSFCQTKPSYDGSFQEPVVLEAQIPNVLVNGSSGVAVGFSTNIPTHNFHNVVLATHKVLEGKEEEARKLLVPHFPTQCYIHKTQGLEDYLNTGKGSITMQARFYYDIEKRGGRKKDRPIISFYNLPFGTDPESICQQIAKGVEQGNITNLADVRDETDREGIRVTVVAKPNTDLEELKNQLFAYTNLMKNFPAQNTVIHNMKPVVLPPVQIIKEWLQWKDDRLVKKFTVELQQIQDRIHIVTGYLIALEKLDQVVTIVKKSKTRASAKNELVYEMKFSQTQAEAILNLRLSSLVSLEGDKLSIEFQSLLKEEKSRKLLIESQSKRESFLKKEVQRIIEKNPSSSDSPLIEVKVVTPKTSKKAPQKGVKAVKYIHKEVSSRGVISTVKTPSRKGISLRKDDKLIAINSEGLLRKLPSNFKGPVFQSGKILMVGKASDIEHCHYMVVFSLEDGRTRANVIKGSDLLKSSSAAKQGLPPFKKLIYFGEGNYKNLTQKEVGIRGPRSQGKLVKLR